MSTSSRECLSAGRTLNRKGNFVVFRRFCSIEEFSLCECGNGFLEFALIFLNTAVSELFRFALFSLIVFLPCPFLPTLLDSRKLILHKFYKYLIYNNNRPAFLLQHRKTINNEIININYV